MASLHAAGAEVPLEGYAQDRCIITNTSGLNLPLVWNSTAAPIKAGTQVQVRFYFRDSTVYAVGAH